MQIPGVISGISGVVGCADLNSPPCVCRDKATVLSTRRWSWDSHPHSSILWSVPSASEVSCECFSVSVCFIMTGDASAGRIPQTFPPSHHAPLTRTEKSYHRQDIELDEDGTQVGSTSRFFGPHSRLRPHLPGPDRHHRPSSGMPSPFLQCLRRSFVLSRLRGVIRKQQLQSC